MEGRVTRSRARGLTPGAAPMSTRGKSKDGASTTPFKQGDAAPNQRSPAKAKTSSALEGADAPSFDATAGGSDQSTPAQRAPAPDSTLLPAAGVLVRSTFPSPSPSRANAGPAASPSPARPAAPPPTPATGGASVAAAGAAGPSPMRASDLIKAIIGTPASSNGVTPQPTTAAGELDAVQAGPGGTPVFGLVTDPLACELLSGGGGARAAPPTQGPRFELPQPSGGAAVTPPCAKQDGGGTTFSARLNAAGFGSPQEVAAGAGAAAEGSAVVDSTCVSPVAPLGAACAADPAADDPAAGANSPEAGAVRAAGSASAGGSPELHVVVRTPAQPRSRAPLAAQHAAPRPGTSRFATGLAAAAAAGAAAARSSGSRFGPGVAAGVAVGRPAGVGAVPTVRRAGAAPSVRIADPPRGAARRSAGASGLAGAPLSSAGMTATSPGHTPYVKDARATALHRAAACKAASARAVAAAAVSGGGSAADGSVAAGAASPPTVSEPPSAPAPPAASAPLAPQQPPAGAAGEGAGGAAPTPKNAARVRHVPSRLMAPTAASLARAAATAAPPARRGSGVGAVAAAAAPAARRASGGSPGAAATASPAGDAPAAGELPAGSVDAAAAADARAAKPRVRSMVVVPPKSQSPSMAELKRGVRAALEAKRAAKEARALAEAAPCEADELASAMGGLSVGGARHAHGSGADVPLRGVPPPAGSHKRFDDAGAAVDSPNRTKLRGVPAARGAHRRFE